MSIKNIARSTTNRERRERKEAELNLIPMIDIMSVMVAFLLVYSADVEVVQNSKGVQVPQSVAEELPKQSVVVMVTKDQLFVQGELVANTEDIRTADAQLIAPLRAVLERPMLGGGPATPTEVDVASREVTVLADKALPYEVVKKVMATCTAAAYGKISLAVLRREEPVTVAGAKSA
ncbi:MAG: biopolymer transporter ExbD [Deltaproteobacteria bacterium]|nr:MAG: biopolymer transporter ExbD [Deltaproteobacteria bacterium]